MAESLFFAEEHGPARPHREGQGLQGHEHLPGGHGHPGYVVSRKLEKVGQRASDTAEIFFEDMFIPEDAMLGEEGRGFYSIMWEMQGERLIVAVAVIAGSMGLY
jgi:alkylation response protein AidB-like acyl-CoA dehydrogenase